MRYRAAALSAILIYLSVMGAPAQGAVGPMSQSSADTQAQGAEKAPAGIRLNTPSGYPVPRFVSLKGETTNCRNGPSIEHKVKFEFKRAGAPVLVVAESVDHWRKIRDPDGDECWTHQSMLRAQTHVLTRSAVDLKRLPKEGSIVSARLGVGVLARLDKRKADWLLVSAANAKGWVRARDVWGGDPLSPPP